MLRSEQFVLGAEHLIVALEVCNHVVVLADDFLARKSVGPLYLICNETLLDLSTAQPLCERAGRACIRLGFICNEVHAVAALLLLLLLFISSRGWSQILLIPERHSIFY